MKPSISVLKDDKVICAHEIYQLFYHVAYKDEVINEQRRLAPQFWLGQFVFFDEKKEAALAELIAHSEKDSLEFIIFHTDDEKGKIVAYNFTQIELNSFKSGTAFNFKAARRLEATYSG